MASKNGIISAVRDRVSNLGSGILNDVKLNLYERLEEGLNKVEKRIVRIEERLILNLISIFIILAGSALLISGLAVWIITKLNIDAYLVIIAIGVILLVVGIIIKLMKGGK